MTDETTEEAEATEEGAVTDQASEETSTEETTETTTQETQQETQEETTDWRESITDTKVKDFAKQFDSPADAAEAALKLRQKLSNAIVKPGKDASEEDIAAYRKALGVPESADKYEGSLPDEGIDDSIKEFAEKDITDFKSKMHEIGATPDVVKAAIEWYGNQLVTVETQLQTEFKKSLESAETELKKEWGDDFDSNVEGAKRAFKEFGGDELGEIMAEAKYKGSPLGNHPAILKAFSKVWSRMGEDGFRMGMNEEEVKSVNDKLNELTTKAHEAMNQGKRAEADRLFKERDELSKKIDG